MLAACWLLSALAAAEPSYALDEAPPEGLWLSAGAGAGVIGGDVVGTTSVGVGLETSPFALHLSVPLTWRAVDLPPETTGVGGCRFLRCEEWTRGREPSPEAFSRVVEKLRLFRHGEVFSLEGGRLFSTLGHGQLVSRHTNAADWDRRHAGLYAEANLRWGLTQVQALVGSFLSPHELFAVRVASSPWHAEADATALARFVGRLRFGVEVAGDAVAPVGPATDDFGNIVRGAQTRPLGGLALDATWPLLDGDGLQLSPWIGASTLTGLVDDGAPGIGGGAALGLVATVDAIFVALRAGARVFVDSPHHRSALFQTLYDVDRRRMLRASGDFSPHGVADLPAPGGIGGAGELELVVMRTARVGARLHIDPVPEATQVELFAAVASGPVTVAVRGLQRAFADPGDIIAFGDRTFVVTEAAWSFSPPFSLFARWLHGPRFDPSAGGAPRAQDDFILGASFDMIFEPE